jgi:hypothetical protein
MHAEHIAGRFLDLGARLARVCKGQAFGGVVAENDRHVFECGPSRAHCIEYS